MKTNNFTTNPDMENLQLLIGRDEYMGQYLFDENFVSLEKENHYFFIDSGNLSKDDVPSASECSYVNITGYSQGDYATVVYKIDPEWSMCNGSTEGKNSVTEYFESLFYNQPLDIIAIIDDEEHRLNEELEDSYRYDKDEISSVIDKLEISDKGKAWLKSQLPDYV